MLWFRSSLWGCWDLQPYVSNRTFPRFCKPRNQSERVFSRRTSSGAGLAGSRCAQAVYQEDLSLFPFTLLQVLVALFHFQTAYLFWGRKRSDSRRDRQGSEQRSLHVTCRDAWTLSSGWGTFEKFKVENDMSQSVSAPPPRPRYEGLPRVSYWSIHIRNWILPLEGQLLSDT